MLAWHQPTDMLYGQRGDKIDVGWSGLGILFSLQLLLLFVLVIRVHIMSQFAYPTSLVYPAPCTAVASLNKVPP